MSKLKIVMSSLFMMAFYFVPQANAALVDCSGTAMFPGSFINGTCRNGFCTADIAPISQMVSLRCSDGSSVMASGEVGGQFLQGECRNGFFSATLPGGFVSWSGSCRGGGSFMADETFLPGGFINGSCQPNGSVMAQTAAETVSVRGSCMTRSNDEIEN